MTENRLSRGSTNKKILLILVCFFLSGLTGLTYEILWMRMIVKIIGGAPFAVSIILTVFMGGLGLGSYLAGRFIDRIEDPEKLVRIYGVLELIIGAYGLVLPLLLSVARPLFAILYNHLFTHFVLYSFLTFAGCAILLCIPVICMGATLPILCRFYITRLSHLGSHAGKLYGLNTIGAAVGALLCGFWLLSLFGVWGTLMFAVGINSVIGLSCIWASHKGRARDESLKEPAPYREKPDQYEIPEETGALNNSWEGNSALVIFAVSGFCAMACEVIWTKLSGLIVGPTTYSFTIVLITFISGLAFGSIIFGRIADKTARPIWLLIITQITAALFVLGVSQFLGNSQLFFAKVLFQFKDNFAALSLVKALILLCFMILPTICFGAAFPLVGKIFTQSVSRVGRSMGFAYAINTVGAVLGSFCAGFILIPLIGKEDSLAMVVGLQLFTSLFVAGILLHKGGKAGALRHAPLALASLAGIMLCIFFPRWDHRLLSTSKYHRFDWIEAEVKKSGWLEALLRGPEILRRSEWGELVYYGDGIGGFTTVIKNPDALGNIDFTMANSGKADASSRGDMKTQTLLTHFPMLFHKNPEKVMVLGLASGITAGEVLCYPVKQLDILEINDQAVKASNFFLPWNNNVLSDPRTNLIIQDGRAHLNLTREKYDVIISEPSNPWMAGLATLFTRDFFELARDRLNEDGIFIQFIHSYEMDWANFSLVGRTFAQAFENSLLIVSTPSGACSDCLLVGFKGENNLVLKNAEQKIPFVQKSTNVSLSDSRLLYRLIISEDLQDLFGRGMVNTDSRPLLEFSAPKLMYYYDPLITGEILSRKWFSAETKDILQQVVTDVDSQIDFAAYAYSLYVPFRNMVDLARATSMQKERFFRLMEAYYSNNPLDGFLNKDDALLQKIRRIQIKTIRDKIEFLPDKALSHNYLGRLFQEEGMTDEAIASWFSAQEIQPDSLKAHTNLGVALARQGRVDEAQKHFEKAMEINPYIANIHVNMGKLFIKKEMFEEAEKHFKKALGLTTNIAYLLAKIYLGTGRFEDALKYLKKAIQIEPDQIEVMNNLAWILATYKKESVRNPDEAIRLAERACELSDYGSPDLVDTLAVAYAAGGRFQEAVDMAEKASELISSLGLQGGGLEVEIQRHLLMFKKGQPYVEGQP